jgi:hypothetical protein
MALVTGQPLPSKLVRGASLESCVRLLVREHRIQYHTHAAVSDGPDRL